MKTILPALLLTLSVDAPVEMQKLLRAKDRDRDERITIKDQPKGEVMSYTLQGRELRGVYALSNLLQELKLASDEKRKELPVERLFENPVHRISRLIRERYWDGLTRRIDEDHLKEVLADSKVSHDGARYLYVPYGDTVALEYYQNTARLRPELKLKVVRLPEKIAPDYVKNLGAKHGLLTLALRKQGGKLEGVPYVVPGGRFNEMYGWDSYFEALGLLQDGRVDLARAMVDNFVYEITYFGKILNANRTYYLTRSQPPFMSSMIREVLSRLPENAETRSWLEGALTAAIKEYKSVWMGEERLTATGLSRYAGSAPGIPPEVEPHHFDHLLKPIAKKRGLSIRVLAAKYEAGTLKVPELDIALLHDRCVRESGHDTTYRWGGRCADFATVDLNSLLYKYELDLAFLIRTYFKGEFQSVRAEDMREAALARKAKIRELLWDPKANLFFDYDVANRKRGSDVSATTFYPLWAHDREDASTRILSDDEAAKLIEAGLKLLEASGGVTATPQGQGKTDRQWEWPNGWAPHQMLLWDGLRSYGHHGVADRLTYKWLYTITKNAVDFNGTVPEKFDVVKRSHLVFAEYGNVGTQFSYITKEGFGWMNASYQVGLRSLGRAKVELLEQLTPPEWIRWH